jgi:hypothetical protein
MWSQNTKMWIQCIMSSVRADDLRLTTSVASHTQYTAHANAFLTRDVNKMILLLLLLLRWYYSPMQTFATLMDFSQSAPFFDLSFQFLILNLFISVCTQFHHLFFGRKHEAHCCKISGPSTKWRSQTKPTFRVQSPARADQKGNKLRF